MPINEQQLLQNLPNAGPVAGVFVPVLNTAMGKYGVVTRLRMAAFIAQVGHESGHLRRVRESLDYKVEALITGFSRERISESDARAFGRTPTRAVNQQAIANCLYGGPGGRRA